MILNDTYIDQKYLDPPVRVSWLDYPTLPISFHTGHPPGSRTGPQRVGSKPATTTGGCLGLIKLRRCHEKCLLRVPKRTTSSRNLPEDPSRVIKSEANQVANVMHMCRLFRRVAHVSDS